MRLMLHHQEPLKKHQANQNTPVFNGRQLCALTMVFIRTSVCKIFHHCTGMAGMCLYRLHLARAQCTTALYLDPSAAELSPKCLRQGCKFAVVLQMISHRPTKPWTVPQAQFPSFGAGVNVPQVAGQLRGPGNCNACIVLHCQDAKAVIVGHA